MNTLVQNKNSHKKTTRNKITMFRNVQNAWFGHQKRRRFWIFQFSGKEKKCWINVRKCRWTNNFYLRFQKSLYRNGKIQKPDWEIHKINYVWSRTSRARIGRLGIRPWRGAPSATPAESTWHGHLPSFLFHFFEESFAGKLLKEITHYKSGMEMLSQEGIINKING